MPGFDIKNLTTFSPPQHLCVRCRGINSVSYSYPDEFAICAVCKLRYLGSERYHAAAYERYMQTKFGCLRFSEDALSHCKRLAEVARTFESKRRGISLLGVLLKAMSEAKHFMHFTSFGISWEFVGVIKLAAHHMRVRGVVSNADPSSARELLEFKSDAPRLEMHVHGKDDGLRDVPHQKLIVIDGVLAFKGSANMTVPGWRKAEKGLEIVEVVTDISEVMRLHNAYFAPLWRKQSDIDDQLIMGDEMDF